MLSETSEIMDDIDLREIRAINVLVCVLNFYDLRTVGPALKRALQDIFEEATEDRDRGCPLSKKKRRLVEALITLGEQARTEEPSDQLVVSRMMPYGGKAPDLVGWEHDLFRQLCNEFEPENEGLFAEWVLTRTGLREPENEGMRGVLVLRTEEETGVRQARLSRHAKVG